MVTWWRLVFRRDHTNTITRIALDTTAIAGIIKVLFKYILWCVSTEIESNKNVVYYISKGKWKVYRNTKKNASISYFQWKVKVFHTSYGKSFTSRYFFFQPGMNLVCFISESKMFFFFQKKMSFWNKNAILFLIPNLWYGMWGSETWNWFTKLQYYKLHWINFVNNINF